MSVIVNIHKAKSNLSMLIKNAQQGEDVIIAKSGTPVAKIIPIKKERMPGLFKGVAIIKEKINVPWKRKELKEMGIE